MQCSLAEWFGCGRRIGRRSDSILASRHPERFWIGVSGFRASLPITSYLYLIDPAAHGRMLHRKRRSTQRDGLLSHATAADFLRP